MAGGDAAAALADRAGQLFFAKKVAADCSSPGVRAVAIHFMTSESRASLWKSRNCLMR